MRPDYCPIGGEPCQSMCVDPCKTLKPSEREEFEERAAILEFDGKMSREGAQIVALQLTLAKREKDKECAKN